VAVILKDFEMPGGRIRLLLLLLLVGLTGCGGFGRMIGRSRPQPTTAGQGQEGVAFENVTLKQTDSQGQLLWQIRAERATYTKDQKVARVRNINGQLFQAGRLAFTLEAKRGEIQPEAEMIRLTGEIVATEVQEKVSLRGREMEWYPQADLLLVRRDLQVSHPQAQASAQEARASSRKQTIEVQGDVVVNTRDPQLQIKANHALWQVDQSLITADPQVQVRSLAPDQISGRAVAGRARIDLRAKSVTLGPKAQVSLVTPPLEVASPQLVWLLNQQQINSQQPVQVWHRQQNVVVTANRSILDLAKQQVNLSGEVEANGLQKQAVLKTDQLTWSLPTQEIAAVGNVVYHQEQPRIDLQGPKAVGKIQAQTILLEGGQIVTEIFP